MCVPADYVQRNTTAWYEAKSGKLRSAAMTHEENVVPEIAGRYYEGERTTVYLSEYDRKHWKLLNTYASSDGACASLGLSAIQPADRNEENDAAMLIPYSKKHDYDWVKNLTNADIEKEMGISTADDSVERSIYYTFPAKPSEGLMLVNVSDEGFSLFKGPVWHCSNDCQAHGAYEGRTGKTSSGLWVRMHGEYALVHFDDGSSVILKAGNTKPVLELPMTAGIMWL